tara:strand:+ start:39 stop:536 length:498 start_codon:yes stop_codon:yes gene_type:complete
MLRVYQITFLISISILLFSCSGRVPLTIGQFISCPERPNCVSTKNSAIENYIEPIHYNGSLNNAKNDLLLVVKKLGSAKIKRELDQFIHVEFTSNIFRFIDDVEFYLADPGVIHFRSASRVGYSDLGVNRTRMEKIRMVFNKINKTRENKVSIELAKPPKDSSKL